MFFFEKKNQKTFVRWSVNMLMRGLLLAILLVGPIAPATAKLPPHVTMTTSHRQTTPAYSRTQPSRKTIYHR